MKCKARTRNGQPCKAGTLKGKKYCFIHDPANAHARAAARKLGGLHRGTPHAPNAAAVNASPRTIPEVFTILDYALAETLVMENGIQRGRLLVSLAAQYVDALKVGELEAQLKELLQVLGLRESLPQ